jgi:hypothetical protein
MVCIIFIYFLEPTVINTFFIISAPSSSESVFEEPAAEVAVPEVVVQAVSDSPVVFGMFFRKYSLRIFCLNFFENFSCLYLFLFFQEPQVLFFFLP